MSAIEETWETQADTRFLCQAGDAYDLAEFDMRDGWDRERARIAACAPEALRMLLEREWTEDSENPPACLACGSEQPWSFLSKEEQDGMGQGHRPDCPWLALMRKAGLR